MEENYPQEFINDLFEEGDRDYHFFYEFFGFVSSLYPEPFLRNSISLNKSLDRELEDSLLLTRFLISSEAYVGFYMKNYGKVHTTYRAPEEFEVFIRKSIVDDGNFIERITEDDRYTVGLLKIKRGEKAPPVTPEIKRIFNVSDDQLGSARLSTGKAGFWSRIWRRNR